MTVVFVKIKSPHDSTQSVYFENVFANGRMGESRDVFRLLVGKPEGKKPLRRPRRRRKGNIKMDLQKNRM